MLNTNYAKLAGEYPEYLRLPVELQSPLIINGVTHPAGAHLSTNDDTAIVQEWEEYEQLNEVIESDCVAALEELG